MNENKTNINWLITIQLRPLLNPYKIRKNRKIERNKVKKSLIVKNAIKKKKKKKKN